MSLLLHSPSFELLWNEHRNAFRLQSPGRALEGTVGVEVVRGRHPLTVMCGALDQGQVETRTVEDAQGKAKEMVLRSQSEHGLELSFSIRLYPTRPFALFRVRVTNVGAEPVHVRRFFFRSAPDGLEMIEDPTGFYYNGWQSWSPAGFYPLSLRSFTLSPVMKYFQGPMLRNPHTPWDGKMGRFRSETVGAVVTPREALVLGGASLADQFVQVIADVRAGHEILTVQSQADDVPLEPGETLASEWFYVEWVALPNVDPFAQYATAVARQMAVPKPRPAPTGWCSWYIYWANVSEADLMENLAAAALLADELPLEVIQLDEGYQEIWGDWTERNERFPHDFKWQADRIRGSGFTPGLWLGPLTAHPKSKLAQEHPDWLLRNARGKPVSAGFILNSQSRVLDPTHSGVQDYLRELIGRAVHEWGYPYLKLDFLYAGALAGQRHNPRRTRAQALRGALRIIREAAGDETYLVGCGLPLGPAVGMVDAMRIGPDTAPEWGPRLYNMRRFFRGNPSLPSLRNSLRGVATRAWMHDRWWTNDPDTLMVRDTQTRLTPAEVRSQVTLLGLTGGLYMLSDNLAELPPERRELAAVLLPPLLDGGDVLDLFARRMPETVVAPVARPWGRWRLVGLFNWRDEPVEKLLPENLPLDQRQAYHLVNFWQRSYERIGEGAQPPVFRLDPHDCVLLGIRKVLSEPHLVATTFHISQGGEVTEWSVTENLLTMTIDIGRLARGEVWLALPARPQAIFLNDEPLVVDNDKDKIVRGVAPGVWAIAVHINQTGTLQVTW